MREVLLDNPDYLFNFMQKNPKMFQKLSVLSHNFVFSGHPKLLAERKSLYFSDAEQSVMQDDLDPNLSQLSQYTSLYSNINKLSNNVIFRKLLNRTKQSVDKMSFALKKDSDHLRSFKGIFYMCDEETREFLATRYFAALKIQNFFRKKLQKKKKKKLNENHFQIIKIGMGKKFLFQLMRQSSSVISSLNTKLKQ